MNTKRIIITDFTPMRKVENYDCASLSIVAVARNVFLPRLNPFNYEVGTFQLGFDYLRDKWEGKKKLLPLDIRSWKDFRDFFHIPVIQRVSNFLEEKIGIKCTKHKQENARAFIHTLEENLGNGLPTIVCCNPFHLYYTDYYQKNPGGLLQNYHQLVVYGISREERKVWVYDPTLKNYSGPIDLTDFIRAVEDPGGIENFEGIVIYTLHYNGKIFNDINRELLVGSLEYYLHGEDTRIKENLLLFFSDFTACFNHLPQADYRNKLLEYGFFAIRQVAFKRLHWWDFFEYYKNLEGTGSLTKISASFKVCVDEILGISNILFTNSLKKKKNLNLEKLAAKLESAIDGEKIIFCSLYEKLQKD
jgi:hypothetical protein